MELGYLDSPANRAIARAKAPWFRRSVLIASAVGFAAFVFYRYVLDHFYLGDPLFYQRYYDALRGRDVISAIILQRNFLGSSEIIYPLIAWAGSNAAIERNTLMAIFDGLMYAVLFRTLRLYRCNPAFIALCMTNFYIVVLATSAERLKFSYICLFIALMAAGRTRVIWLALAPLAHFQSLITQGSIFAAYFLANLSFRTKVILSLVAAVGAGIMLYFFSSALIGKFSSYRGQGSVVDSVSGLALCGIALVILHNRYAVFAAMAPLVILTFILGSDRMNMITFTVFIYFCLNQSKTSHPIVLLILAYFSFKSIGFVDNILKFGNGFIG